MIAEEEVKGAGKLWLKSLRPPKANATDRHVQAWRWAVAITTGVNTLALAAHVALACGLISPVYAGFAHATDVEQIQHERKVERQTDLEQKILEIREKQCASTGQVKALHAGTLQKMLVEYQKLSGAPYPMPSCEDFQ